MPSLFDQQITFLYTSDLAATAVFYQQVMGLPLVLDQGSCHIYQMASNAFLGFCVHLSDGGQRPSGVIVTLVTDDVDAWYEQLQQKGVAFTKPPELNPKFNIYHCFFRDPNGYLIEIQRFQDPNWRRF